MDADVLIVIANLLYSQGSTLGSLESNVSFVSILLMYRKANMRAELCDSKRSGIIGVAERMWLKQHAIIRVAVSSDLGIGTKTFNWGKM